jgi:threonine dehydrogenase-like Zn-dependent dehydrogenase
MPVQNAVLLPGAIDLLEAAFLEPLTVGLHAVNIMSFQPGRPVAVTGVGTIGLLLVQSLRALGAGPIAALDVAPERLELARSLGADLVLDSRDPEAPARAVEFARDRWFPFVFETAGVPAAEILALRLAGPTGHVMFVGTPHAPLTLQPDEFELINRKELVVQGSWMNYSAPFPGWEWRFGAELLGARRVAVRPLLDRLLPLAEAAAIPELLSRRGAGALKGKLLLQCSP